MSTIATSRMTSRQFMELPEDPHEIRRELVDGEIIVSPSPSFAHGVVSSKLNKILRAHVELHRLGEVAGDVDNRVSKFTVRRPDLFYFSAARLHLATGEKTIQGPPDLSVEFISPGSERTDRVEKFAEYATYGVANYWIIDPIARTAEAYVLTDGKYALAADGSEDQTVRFPPFLDLEIPLGELWLPRS